VIYLKVKGADVKFLRGRTPVRLWTFLFLAVAPLVASAQALQPEALPEDVIARRGDVDLKITEIDVKVGTMPEELQAGYVTEADRASRLIDLMLLNKQLALKAREQGLDKDPRHLAQVELAATELLAAEAIRHHMAQVTLPDLEPLARERYLADPEALRGAPRIDVTHALVSTDGIAEAEAKALAEDIARRVKTGESFSDVVAAIDDERVTTQSIPHLDVSRVEPMFARTVGDLDKVGDISEPVRTRYGYHVVRLDLMQERPVPTFEEAKPRLMEELTKQFRDKARRDYLASFSQLDVQLNDPVVQALPTRYLPAGADVSAQDAPATSTGQ